MQKWQRIFVLLILSGAVAVAKLTAQETPPAPSLPRLSGTIHLNYRISTSNTSLSVAEKQSLVVKARTLPPDTDTAPVYLGQRSRLPESYQPTADYWSSGKGSTCWTIDSLNRRSAIVNPANWITVTEDQLGVIVVYARRSATAPPNPSGNLAEASQAIVPLLGFVQEQTTASNDKQTFDSAGHLILLQHGKQKDGTYAQEYEYSDYATVTPGVAIPGVVVQWNRAAAKQTDTPSRTIYTLRSWDTDPTPTERFTRQHPPQNSFVADYRYRMDTKTPLRYRFAGTGTVDAESPKQFAARKQAMRPMPSTIGKLRKVTDHAGITLVHLPGGSFRMGQKDIAEPVHSVRVSPFWIGQYEVTNAQFERYKKRPRPAESQADNQPVTRVSYADATAYCRWLTKRSGTPYRLPTEAEWEYAARGGLMQKRYPWGDIDIWGGLAALGQETTSRVGTYYPNGFGLYDMAGNVAEWVSDWYDHDYYKHSVTVNPKGPKTPPTMYGKMRLLRGGHFEMQQGECALRIMTPETPRRGGNPARFRDKTQSDGTGFRVVREDP